MKPDKEEVKMDKHDDSDEPFSSLRKKIDFFKTKELILQQENSILTNSTSSCEELLKQKENLKDARSKLKKFCFQCKRELNKDSRMFELSDQRLWVQLLYSNDAKEQVINVRNAHTDYVDIINKSSKEIEKERIQVFEKIETLSLEIKSEENHIDEIKKNLQELRVSNIESDLDETKLKSAHLNERFAMNKKRILEEIQIKEENRNLLAKYANNKNMLSDIKAESEELLHLIPAHKVQIQKRKIKMAILKAKRNRFYDLRLKYNCCMLEQCQLSNKKSQLEKTNAEIKEKNGKHKKYIDKFFKHWKAHYKEKDDRKSFKKVSKETKMDEEIKTEESPEKKPGPVECFIL